VSRTTSKNAGRSTTGEARVPYYRQADHIEAAKHLRLTVTRYIADRAALREVEEAMVMLRAAAPVAGERGARHASDCDCATCAYSKKHPQLNAPRCWEHKPAAIRAAIDELRHATRPEQRTSYEHALHALADFVDQLLATTDDRGSIKSQRELIEKLRNAVPRRKESA
jgi:hypothetical protein